MRKPEDQDPNFDPLAFWDSAQHKELIQFGDRIWAATQYGNKFIVDDTLSESLLRLAAVAYYQGVAPCLQLEGAIYLIKAMNLEYPYAGLVRTYMEHAGRVHKARTAYGKFLDSSDLERFNHTSLRLVQPYVAGGGSGFNILTLIDGLCDVSEEARDVYDDLSTYLHGDMLSHMFRRKLSHIVGIVHKVSPFISSHEEYLNQLRSILHEDLATLANAVQPFVTKMKSNGHPSVKPNTEG